MEDILNKIVLNRNTDKKDIISYDRLELEINLKIEREKTKQLELIKDIRKIEKSIKEKELYCKRKQTVIISDDDSDDSDLSDSDLSDSDLSSNDSDYKKVNNKTHNLSHTNNSVNLNNNNNNIVNLKSETISLCSIDSDCDYDNEIEIK